MLLNSGTEFLLLYLLQFACGTENQLDVWCHGDFECNKPIKCAFCNIERKCEIIDKDIFENELPCKYSRHHCDKGYCNPEWIKYIKEYEGYGECICYCYGFNAYGNRCEFYGPDEGENYLSYSSGMEFITPPHVEFNQPIPMMIIAMETPAPFFIVEDQMGGYFARIQTPEPAPWNISECMKFAKNERFFFSDICPLTHWDYWNMVYIPRFVIPFDLVTPPNLKVTSFTQKIQMDAYHPDFKRKLLSSHSHHYHVNYPENGKFTNTPIIRFTGCSKNISHVKKYHYKDRIHLTANFFFVNSSSYSLDTRPESRYDHDLGFKWEAYRFEGDTYKKQEINDFRIGPLSWDIPSYNWFGMYVINLTVTGHFIPPGERRESATKKDSNFNVCLVEVEFLDLKAIIRGGSTRFVFKQHGLTLDASKSRNPNTPDGKSDMLLTFTCNWTQEAVCKPYTINILHYQPYTIEPRDLQSQKAYNFTLKVTSMKLKNLRPAFASQIIDVGDVGKDKYILKEIGIDCTYNCEPKTNPKDIVCLRVGGPWTLLDSLIFEWVQYEFSDEGITENSVDAIRQSDTPSFIIIINENAMTQNTMYEFKVTLKNSPQYAIYPIITTFLASHICQIDPESGEVGLTNFKLSCLQSELTKNIEFYDKHEVDGPDFSGRMIAAQETAKIENFVLTRGRVEILSFDEYGMVTPITINVKLSKSNDATKAAEQIFNNLLQLSGVQGVGESLKTASVISDLLSSASKAEEESSTYILETLVRFVSTLSIKRYKDAKLGVSTLHITLLAARGSLSLDGAWHAARTIQTLAHALAVGLKEGHLCTFRVLYQIISRVLDCLYIVLEVEEKYVGNSTLFLKYINPVIYTRVKEISQFVMKSSFHLQSALSYRHLPAQKQKLIESSLGNLSIWIKVDIPTSLSKYSQDEYRTKMFPVIVSDDLAKDVTEKGFFLALQFMSFRQDPTRLARTNVGVTLDASVCFKGNDDQTCQYTKILKYGIQVAFDISDLISQAKFRNITVRRLDHHLDPNQLDIKLPVYKIDPLPLADVDANFRLYAKNTELLVLVEKDLRPTYEKLMKETSKVTPAKPVYPVVTDPSDQQHLYYLAIQPGAQIQQNGTVSFDMKMYSKMCYTWHNYWETRGCQSITHPGTGALICECHRLSLIGGFVQEVMYSLEVVGEFPLSLTISGAISETFLSLLLLLLTFLLLALICRRADRYDRTKRFVSILPDNFPGEKFGYLVRVITGARIGASTDSAVGIKILGTLNDSRGHILGNETYDVMDKMGEDWFLIYESGSLGKIACLELWHDSAGAKADWFCDSITVYDLHHKDCYFFIVNDWITLSLTRFPEVCLFPTAFSEITSPSRVFLDYFKSGFHLSHLWLDTIARHPRDPVSRIDRLAIILCFILVSMAVSIIFIAISDNYMEVDDFSYSVTWFMVEKSVYTCIPATAVACVLMHMFRRIYCIIFYTEKEEEKVTHERRVTRVSVHEDYLSSPSITSLGVDKNHIHYGRRHKRSQEGNPKRTLAEAINLTLMPKPLVPVQLEGDEPNVIIKKNWLIISWIIVVVIIIVCLSLTIFLSQKLPLVKTMKWAIIVGLSIFIHAIILLPLKITFVSALLAVAFKRIIYKDVYTFDPQDGRQINHFGMIRYLTNLVKLRSQPMYKPLYEVFREEHRQKMLRSGRWRRLYELVVQIMFLLVIGTLLRGHIRTKYQANAHQRTLMKEFDKVHNTTDLKHFQRYCEPYLFNYIWYNWKILSHGSEQSFFRKDWIHDGVNRMVGKVRLRQFRVKPGYCKPSVNLSIDCAAPFSGGAEDSRDYIPFWIKQDDITNDLVGLTFLRKWSYNWPSDDSNFFYDGKTGQTYPSGGYTWDLGASDEEMDASLDRLWEEGWIGHYTRAVLAQFKVYNVNTGLFSEIALVSEQTTAGEILPTTVVHSVDINIQFDSWLAIFIFFAFMLCVRVFTLTNFVGVMGLFKSWRGLFELVMAVNALAVLLYLLLHLLIVPQYVTDYQLHSDELRFFDFYKIAHYAFTARALLCALYVLNQIRFYSLWRFGKTVYRFLLTVLLSLKHLIWLAVIFVLFQIILFRCVGYLLLMFIDVLLNPNMLYRSNYSYFSVSNEMSGLKILCFVMSFSSVIIMTFFVCIFALYYKTARNEFIRDWNVDNYLTFVLDEITAMLNKPIVRQTTMKVASTMVARYEVKKDYLRMQSQAALK